MNIGGYFAKLQLQVDNASFEAAVKHLYSITAAANRATQAVDKLQLALGTVGGAKTSKNSGQPETTSSEYQLQEAQAKRQAAVHAMVWKAQASAKNAELQAKRSDAVGQAPSSDDKDETKSEKKNKTLSLIALAYGVVETVKLLKKLGEALGKLMSSSASVTVTNAQRSVGTGMSSAVYRQWQGAAGSIGLDFGQFTGDMTKLQSAFADMKNGIMTGLQPMLAPLELLSVASGDKALNATAMRDKTNDERLKMILDDALKAARAHPENTDSTLNNIGYILGQSGRDLFSLALDKANNWNYADIYAKGAGTPTLSNKDLKDALDFKQFQTFLDLMGQVFGAGALDGINAALRSAIDAMKDKKFQDNIRLIGEFFGRVLGDGLQGLVKAINFVAPTVLWLTTGSKVSDAMIKNGEPAQIANMKALTMTDASVARVNQLAQMYPNVDYGQLDKLSDKLASAYSDALYKNIEKRDAEGGIDANGQAIPLAPATARIQIDLTTDGKPSGTAIIDIDKSGIRKAAGSVQKQSGNGVPVVVLKASTSGK